MTSSVEQSVIIPSTATDLTVQTLRGLCDDAGDTLHVSIDGNDIGTVVCDGEDGNFVEQTFSVAGYNDDAAHSLLLGGTVGGTNGSHTNFFVDDVSISDNVETPGSPSVCTPVIEDVACNIGTVDFTNGIPGPWTVVDNSGSGLVWSNITGAGESGNYTGGDGDAATVSSDVYGPADFDTDLRSNVFSLPNVSTADLTLDYLANYQNFAAFDFLDLDISEDDGATWTTLLSWNEDHGGFRSTPGEAVNIDLSPYYGQSDLQLRWRYYDPTTFDWDWYAQIDNVKLGCTFTADIDIKPGSSSNPINLKSKGVIPVAILTTDDFDATTVDPLSVEFGPAGATESHGKGHIEDVDGDGDDDLLLHFNTQETGIQCDDTSASLTGLTYEGLLISGTDSITITKCP